MTKYKSLKVKFRNDYVVWEDEHVEAEIIKNVLRIIDALGMEILIPMDIVQIIFARAED